MCSLLLAKRRNTHERLTELFPVSNHLLQLTLITNSLRIGAVVRREERAGGQARLMEDRKEGKKHEKREEKTDAGGEKCGEYKFSTGGC